MGIVRDDEQIKFQNLINRRRRRRQDIYKYLCDV